MAKTYKDYYETPTQVVWCDSEGYWNGGIAYEDYVICAECGAVNLIEEIEDEAPDWVKNPIHEYSYWENLSDTLMGDEYPETFDEEPDEEVADDEE